MKIVWVVVLGWSGIAAAGETCRREGVTLEVLGSAGPERVGDRASSGYLVWVDKVPLYVVDFGAGAMGHFAESGATIDTLEAVFVSHLHDDHASELPALWTGAGASARKDDLPIYGPAGKPESLTQRVHKLFPGAAPFKVVPHEVKDTKRAIRTIFTSKLGEVDAMSVAHDSVPTLAYRVRSQGKSVVLAGDSDGVGDALIQLAQGADLFVVSDAIPESASAADRKRYMLPSRIGEIAAAAKVKRVVLSHLTSLTLGEDNEKAARASIAKHYKGPVSFATDGECLR